MKVWLQTRGIVRDYAFLGTTVPDFWWSQPLYKETTSFELPTLILERCDTGTWRCLISALPSIRYDRVKTPIRYTLVLEGTQDDQGVLLKLIGYALSSFGTNPPARETQLTRLLDEAIGDQADKWLEAGREEAQVCVEDLVRKFTDLPSSQINEKLLDAIKALLAGMPNSANTLALLNFISAKTEPLAIALQASMSPNQSKLLLLPSPVAGGRIENFFFITASSGLPKSEQVNGYERSDRSDTSHYRKVMCTIVLIILVLLFVGFMIWYNASL